MCKSRWRWDLERGSATPAVLAALAVLLVIGMVVAGLIDAQVDRVRTQAAADLAALAAVRFPSALAMEPSDPTVPCGLARQVVERSGAVLADCWPDDGDIRVIVTRQGTYLGIPWTVTVRARAGPKAT